MGGTWQFDLSTGTPIRMRPAGCVGRTGGSHRADLEVWKSSRGSLRGPNPSLASGSFVGTEAQPWCRAEAPNRDGLRIPARESLWVANSQYEAMGRFGVCWRRSAIDPGADPGSDPYARQIGLRILVVLCTNAGSLEHRHEQQKWLRSGSAPTAHARCWLD